MSASKTRNASDAKALTCGFKHIDEKMFEGVGSHWLVFFIYGDESSDARNERVFTVAALLGDEGKWNRFKDAWRCRTGGVCFHAADCESGYGDYRGVDPIERAQLPLDLAMILANSGIIGFGIGIDVPGCRKAFPDMLPDQTYYSAFLRTVDFHGSRPEHLNEAKAADATGGH